MTSSTRSVPASQLPSNPSLKHLRLEAKSVLKAHKGGNVSCCKVLRHLRQFQDKSDDEILKAKACLQEVQFALAIEYGFQSWSELKKHVLGKTEAGRFLHIHCGDSSAKALQESKIPGDVLVWKEIYVEGPVPGNLSEEEFQCIRASYFMTFGLKYDGVLQGMSARYRKIKEAGKYEEVILWFDACLFDQTIMIYLIDLCAKQSWEKTKLSLICVGECAGFDRFCGLGELFPEQLASIFDTRHEVTKEEINLAGEAWKAFTSANPQDIEHLLQGDCSALPYLKDALLRHLQQFPSVRNGLNRLKNQILAVVASGIRKLGPIFDAVSKKEERPFFGDTSLWRCINQLASGNESLLRVSGPDSLSELTKIKPGPEPDEPPSPKKLNLWDVDITEEGKAVLAGNQDAIRLNGIDKWIGGVHLQGAEAAWRWDEEPGKIVQIAVSQTVFKNWKALKESVNSSQLTKSGLQAEHGRVWIEGVPDGEVGGAWDMLLKGMEILLKYRGERTGLNELMAYSGDAFHLCHSSTWQEMAYMMIPTDTLANVVKVYGYEGEWLYFPPSPKTPGTERKTYEILGKLWADIDAGHPVMIGGCADKGCGPWSVVVGYDRSKMQMCHIGIGESYRWTGIRGLDYDLNPEDGKCGFWNGRLRGKLGGRTGGWLDNLAYRLGGKTNAPSQKEGVVSTLKRAVELFSASPFFLGSSGAFNFYYGGEAYQQWATALRQLSYPDDLKKPRSKDAWGQYDMGNMDTQVDQIVRGRAAAAEFCERATEQFPIAKDRLTAAAKLYREEVNIAREAFRVFIPLWDGNDKPREAWFSDKAQRDAGADSILRMLEKEKSAIIEIEKALAMIE